MSGPGNRASSPRSAARPSTPTTGGASPLQDGRQRWREDAVAEFLASEDADMLFVAGCEENQVALHPRFDVIILLSARAEVLTEPLASGGQPYGKSRAALARVLDDSETIEPRLRRIADHEIRTTIPLTDVVTTVLRVAGA